MIIRLLVIAYIFVSVSAWGQTSSKKPVSFYAEDIRMSVSDSEVNISGIYYFKNNTDKEGYFPLVFPFYIDSLSEFPYFIDVYLMDNNIKVPLDYSRIGDTDKIRFGLPLEPKSEIAWYLDYRQKIKSNRAVYILRSTNTWGKPLERASYNTLLPAKYSMTDIWPPPDTTINDGHFNIYISNKKSFIPQRDMEIKWEVVK